MLHQIGSADMNPLACAAKQQNTEQTAVQSRGKSEWPCRVRAQAARSRLRVFQAWHECSRVAHAICQKAARGRYKSRPSNSNGFCGAELKERIWWGWTCCQSSGCSVGRVSSATPPGRNVDSRTSLQRILATRGSP